MKQDLTTTKVMVLSLDAHYYRSQGLPKIYSAPPLKDSNLIDLLSPHLG